MAQSWGRDTQPYLYNGKEFVEAHGLNEYEYGFRNYYSPIGRFTTVDPLAEQTPWQSPYSYAGNRFVNAIDWMGLSGLMSGYSSTYNLTCVNGVGDVVYHKDSWDTGVYRVDDDWEVGDLLLYSMLIGREIPGIRYIVGECCDFWLNNGDYFSGSLRSAIAVDGRGYTWQYGFYKDNPSNEPNFSNENQSVNFFSFIWANASSYLGIKSGLNCNEIYWYGKNGNLYYHYEIHTQGGFANSYKIARNAPIKIAGNVLSVVGIAFDVIEVATTKEIKPSNVINIALGAASFSGIGAIIAGGYIAVDTTIWLFTGNSIEQRIDNKYGTYKIH